MRWLLTRTRGIADTNSARTLRCGMTCTSGWTVIFISKTTPSTIQMGRMVMIRSRRTADHDTRPGTRNRIGRGLDQIGFDRNFPGNRSKTKIPLMKMSIANSSKTTTWTIILHENLQPRSRIFFLKIIQTTSQILSRTLEDSRLADTQTTTVDPPGKTATQAHDTSTGLPRCAVESTTHRSSRTLDR